MSNKVVIIGAGYAGVEAALTLYKKKKRGEAIDIFLIDKNPYHTLLTELHEVAGNRIDEGGVIVPLHDIFRYTDVNIVQDEIRTFDLGNKTIKSDNKVYTYDYLIIAAGSQPNYYGIPGLRENSFALWSFDDAIRIRNHIRNCFIKASLEQDPATRKKLLTFVVGGGGFTGVEIAGEIALWIRSLCREYRISRLDVRLCLVEALPDILSSMKKKNRDKTEKYLKKRLGIEVLTNSTIESLHDDILSIKNRQEIESKTVIWTAGVKACDIADMLSLPQGKACRVEVDEYTLTDYPDVYAAGDISLFKHEDSHLPAMVEPALQTGKAAANNILATIRGKEKEELKPKFSGSMVSVGSYFAVAEIFGVSLNRFFAIIMKYLVNMHYLFGIGGFELVLRYLKHEFLYKKQRKTMLEAFITKPTMMVWLVPLRLYLGYYWFMEGLKKLQGGWLLNEFLAGRAPDAGSSASITEEGVQVFRIITDNTPGWYAWIADNLILPFPMLFQYLIVISEIGLGLAFFFGVFTIPAAFVALGMNLNFLLSTGMYPETYWLIPAQIAMFADAGKSFGGDYFIMPFLMRKWRCLVRNRGRK